MATNDANSDQSSGNGNGNNIQREVGHLSGRVGSLEHDLDSLTKTVERIIQTTSEGFDNTRAMIADTHKSTQAELRELGRSVERGRQPQYSFWSLMLSGCVLVVGWYVSSQIEPVRKMLEAEKEARILTDDRYMTQITMNTNRINDLNSCVVSNTPEGKRAFLDDQIHLHERVTKLEAWEEARKYFNDRPSK